MHLVDTAAADRTFQWCWIQVFQDCNPSFAEVGINKVQILCDCTWFVRYLLWKYLYFLLTLTLEKHACYCIFKRQKYKRLYWPWLRQFQTRWGWAAASGAGWGPEESNDCSGQWRPCGDTPGCWRAEWTLADPSGCWWKPERSTESGWETKKIYNDKSEWREVGFDLWGHRLIHESSLTISWTWKCWATVATSTNPRR